VLALGAACGSKRLSEALVGEMGARLAAEGMGLVLLGGPGDDEIFGARLAARFPKAVSRVARGPWSEAAAWMAEAKAVLANDSGLAHLAATCGANLVTVFGPTLPRHTAPRALPGRTAAMVRKEDLDCLECDLWHCPLEGHPCMTALDPEAIWTPLKEALGR
jgi:heptosyltransferase-2